MEKTFDEMGFIEKTFLRITWIGCVWLILFPIGLITGPRKYFWMVDIRNVLIPQNENNGKHN